MTFCSQPGEWSAPLKQHVAEAASLATSPAGASLSYLAQAPVSGWRAKQSGRGRLIDYRGIQTHPVDVMQCEFISRRHRCHSSQLVAGI